MSDTQYLSGKKRKKKVIGRWSKEEHDCFVNCLKVHGKDWDKLEEMIPTRSGVQIRSHLQKYFERIKKEFSTNNPMEFIMKDMCDISKVYKFDKSMIKQDSNPDPTQDLVGLYQNRSYNKNRSEEEPIMKKLIQEPTKNKENADNKKREMKEKSKRIELDVQNGTDSHKRRANSSENSSIKLFKIQKVAKNATESISYSNSDGQKNNSMDNEQSVKLNKPSKKTGSSLREKKGCSVIVMNKGEIIIQGNQIITSVPCKFEKLKDSVTAITPTKPVRIIIEEISSSSAENSDSEKKVVFEKKVSYKKYKKPEIADKKDSSTANTRSTVKTSKRNPSLGSLYPYQIQGYELLLSHYCTCTD
ncbi:unnamed protein product [Moneuplotes crassus]|uniref:Uncharacterized protein n=1 Tax=Euplotes crassus TaxID=5936 RepID=A0AAD1U7Q2_EUPCR|nr:unnamed protein product [Moneuplotes crassus]